ncbi:hypothetical protein P5Y53_18550 [Dyella jiangningensis]|uniref:hypothetical protein n=1 Tax=Dyella jiangningensis TaxID=1379159 RepID=UPI0024100B25|nr:hypothetical protein [Dyella jiangningensis]MDG2539685.1 hypothetical protein [Dyella jiangningensis]
MSSNVLGAAAASLLALAMAMPALAADQDADAVGMTASYGRSPGVLALDSSPGRFRLITYAPASLASTSASLQATLGAMGLSDGRMLPDTGYLQVASRTFGRWTFALAVAMTDTAPPATAAPAAWDAPRWADVGDPPVVDFTPFSASYRISATDRIAVSLQMGMQNKPSRAARLMAASANIWTLMPKVAYTKVMPSSDTDASTVVAVGSFSRSAVANYQNVAVGRIEALVMHRNGSGWGYGGVAALIQQPYMDFNPASGKPPGMDANSGLAMGVGPQISWSSRWLGSGVEFQCRWIYEFRTPTGHPDQPMLLSATLHL